MSIFLPFQQDPDSFLESHLWGCHEGRHLSALCSRLIESTKSSSSPLDALSAGKVRNALLDCYVHALICRRCVSIEQIVCKEGYDLVRRSQGALSGLMRLAQEEDKAQPLSADHFSAGFSLLWRHRNGCEACAAKRYGLPVWNIEAALSQQTEL